jgi:hypothetical protein
MKSFFIYLGKSEIICVYGFERKAYNKENYTFIFDSKRFKRNWKKIVKRFGLNFEMYKTFFFCFFWRKAIIFFEKVKNQTPMG